MTTPRSAAMLMLLGLCFVRIDARAQGPAHRLDVAEAKLGKEVKDRMVANEDSVFAKGSKVFLWMKLTGGSSDQITITWKSGDHTHATTLVVGSSPWRTWASKTVGTAGRWTVAVADSSGKTLKEIGFRVE